jgi:hypothetical protein
MKTPDEIIWIELNKLRSKGELLDVPALVNAARTTGHKIGLEALSTFLGATGTSSPELVVPSHLLDFVAGYLKSKGLGTRLLDPFYSPGGLLLGVAERLHPSEVIALTRLKYASDLLSILQLSVQPTVIVGDLNASLAQVKSIEAVVASPPIGVGRASAIIEGITVAGELGELGFLQASLRMGGKGAGLALFPPNFGFRLAPNGIRDALGDLGLCLSAFVCVPVGLCSSHQGESGKALCRRAVRRPPAK